VADRLSVRSQLQPWLSAATYGINTGGTVYRMDDVPIALRPAFPSPYPGDEEILRAIKERVIQLQDEGQATKDAV
jgi:formylmethanofuran dehydrogenase subunit B